MVKAALKRPITILVLFIGLLMFSIMSLRTVPIDICTFIKGKFNQR